MNIPDVRLDPPTSALEQERPSVSRVVVRNTGPEVERYDLSPAGPLAEWSQLSESEVRVWPGESHEVALTVKIPFGSQPHAGPTVLGVVARAHDGASAAAHEPADVAPYVAASLPPPRPHAVETARRALVLASPVNAGNTPLAVRIFATDREDRLKQESPKQEGFLHLQPGQGAEIAVVLRCAKIIWIGKNALPRAFTIELASDRVLASADAVLTQVPIVRKWVVALWAALGLVAWLLVAMDPSALAMVFLAILALIVLSLGIAVSALRRLFSVAHGRSQGPDLGRFAPGSNGPNPRG